jgi:thiol-disulfide isomerase/thioredoxin
MKALAVVCLLAGLVAAQGVVRKSPELAFAVPGKGEQLLSHYRGKVVALEFVSTTCPHCQAASKIMSKMQQKYGSRGLQALDVAVNPNADLLVENFARDFQIRFPVGWLNIDQMMTYMGFTGRPMVPQLVLIDRQGFIHYQTPAEGDGNAMKEEVISGRIERLLAGND